MESVAAGDCRFCHTLSQTRKRHTIPTALDIEALEGKVLELKHQLDNLLQSSPNNLSGSSAPNVDRKLYARQRYNVMLWKVERCKELQRKGYGAPFDLWIDHVPYSEMVAEMWAYESLREKIPDEFIEDSETPVTRAKARRTFPPGARQTGDIRAATEGGFDEFAMDAEDDHAQHALADMYRIRNMSPMLALEDDEVLDDGDEEDEADEEDRPIGTNLGLASANAAIEHFEQVLIPQTIRLWRDVGKPRTDFDSKIQMKDYLADVHTFTTPGDTPQPSMEAYRAIAKLAFSLDSANRIWRKRGITDEDYSKLSRDGMQQIASLRDTLDQAGVLDLPPLLDKSPKARPRQQKSIKPIVIDRWMNSADTGLPKLYTYDPARPLGPMISENAQDETGRHLSPSDSLHNNVSPDNRNRTTNWTSDGEASHEEISREEFTGKTLELDQLVEQD